MGHQVEGVEFLLSKKSGLIAFEQGLGKTLVALEAYFQARTHGLVETLLVICPNSLKYNWQSEIQKYRPNLAVEIISGNQLERRRALLKTSADVVVFNYEGARSELSGVTALMRRRRTALVLDESHYIKNHRSLTSIFAQHLAPFTTYRWLLSGTPVTNTAADIYPQLCLVAGSQPLGSSAAFETKYVKSINGAQALASAIRPYVFRKTKEDCLDLPDKTFVDIYVDLPLWQRRLYDGFRDELILAVDGMTQLEFNRFAPTALTKLLRLLQIASNPSLLRPEDTRSPAKFLELDRLLDELIVQNNRKVILWSYYVPTIRLFEDRYRQYGSVSIYGDVSPSQRQDAAKAFQNDPEVRLLIANPAAAATGFTLTAATYAIYETLSWRYDLYAQSQDRNHRIGQTMPATYIRLIARDTIETAVTDVLARKANLASNVLGDAIGSVSLERLSPQEFCDMLRSNRLPKHLVDSPTF